MNDREKETDGQMDGQTDRQRYEIETDCLDIV